jgi:hypothetical protein
LRSGFERTLAAQLKSKKVKFEYESLSLNYTISHIYTPDFVIANGVIIEAKGKLDPQTRQKMLAVKAQHPELDIRFVFMRGENKLSKASKTTYMDWAKKHGFPASDGTIPDEWTK